MLPCLSDFSGRKNMWVNNETIWIESYLEESNILMSSQKEKRYLSEHSNNDKKNPFGIIKSCTKNVLDLKLKKLSEIISPRWMSFVLTRVFLQVCLYKALLKKMEWVNFDVYNPYSEYFSQL